MGLLVSENMESFNTFNLAGYGTVPEAAGAPPRKTVLRSTFGIPEAQKVKIRYGPYKVPNMKKKNLIGIPGMLFNYPQRNIAK